MFQISTVCCPRSEASTSVSDYAPVSFTNAEGKGEIGGYFFKVLQRNITILVLVIIFHDGLQGAREHRRKTHTQTTGSWFCFSWWCNEEVKGRVSCRVRYSHPPSDWRVWIWCQGRAGGWRLNPTLQPREVYLELQAVQWERSRGCMKDCIRETGKKSTPTTWHGSLTYCTLMWLISLLFSTEYDCLFWRCHTHREQRTRTSETRLQQLWTWERSALAWPESWGFWVPWCMRVHISHLPCSISPVRAEGFKAHEIKSWSDHCEMYPSGRSSLCCHTVSRCRRSLLASNGGVQLWMASRSLMLL